MSVKEKINPGEREVSRVKEYLKEMAVQVLSGGSAGFVEVCIMHPLDLIKTRLQLQLNLGISKADAISNPHYYRGIIDCMSKMYRNEGFLAFYKGILPPIVAETPKRAIKFLTFEQYKQLFLFGSPTPTPLTLSLSGFFAGITEAIFVNPFEVVKVTLQSNRDLAKASPSTWSITKKIIETDGIGLKGLNKGLTATIARNGLFNSIYFGLYFSARGYLPVLEDPLHEFLKKVSIGFISGTLGSTVNIPFDVVKSRIQGPQPIAGEIKYKSTIQTIILVTKEEGFGALYKGLLPKVLRLGPGGAIMLIVYENVHEYMSKLLLNKTISKI